MFSSIIVISGLCILFGKVLPSIESATAAIHAVDVKLETKFSEHAGKIEAFKDELATSSGKIGLLATQLAYSNDKNSLLAAQLADSIYKIDKFVAELEAFKHMLTPLEKNIEPAKDEGVVLPNSGTHPEEKISKTRTRSGMFWFT